MARVYYVMGVAGCGKSTIGQALANRLGLPFLDGDDFHPAANVRKMSQGQPLNDADREPWLTAIAAEARRRLPDGGAVIACSALKARYRLILERGMSHQVQWIYLKGDMERIHARMRARKGHFMPVELLRSQFEALEEPEQALVVEIDQSPQAMVEEILKRLR